MLSITLSNCGTRLVVYISCIFVIACEQVVRTCVISDNDLLIASATILPDTCVLIVSVWESPENPIAI